MIEHTMFVLRGVGGLDMREERIQAVAGGWNPPFVALASLEVQKQKSRGRSGN